MVKLNRNPWFKYLDKISPWRAIIGMNQIIIIFQRNIQILTKVKCAFKTYRSIVHVVKSLDDAIAATRAMEYFLLYSLSSSSKSPYLF